MEQNFLYSDLVYCLNEWDKRSRADPEADSRRTAEHDPDHGHNILEYFYELLNEKFENERA